MVLFNGQMAAAVTPFFASVAAHGTGTRGGGCGADRAGAAPHHAGCPGRAPAPWWSYLAGLSGAVTVVLTSFTVNSALALSGTLALGLAGQVVFGLVADGLRPVRPAAPVAGAVRALAALGLICAGSLTIIFLWQRDMMAALAFAAGLLVSLSRQLNGRLALATSPLVSSFWNHAVGLAALALAGSGAGRAAAPGLVGRHPGRPGSAGRSAFCSSRRQAGWWHGSARSTRRRW